MRMRFNTAKYRLLLLMICLCLRAGAQIPQGYVSSLPSPRVRITAEINNEDLITLRGNTYPLANPANDLGEVSADQPISRILLLLHRSPEQEAALEKLLVDQQNPASPLYHQWLTPEQFGEWFGLADQDVQTITTWLASEGFDDIQVSQGKMVIEFSGTAGEIRNAFHTAIHRYEAAGSLHLANQSDPSIPTALAPVLAGVVSLNNFGRRSEVIPGPRIRYMNGKAHPEIVVGNVRSAFSPPSAAGGVEFYAVAPYDFATIYDLLPLWNEGLDGTGVKIAISGQTDLNPADPQQFRSFFGLPANNPLLTVVGNDPGINSDEIEADTDVEWSGAVAKGATIELVSSATTEATAGVDLSALYIVDNDLAPVMSESYGECELFLGTTGNAFEDSLWQQASAEGITVLVASGDQGSAACDPTTDTQNLSVHPMGVNGLASTPYDIAVGGTDFHQNNDWSQYWSNTNDPTTKESVLGYIPEVPWNASCGSSLLDSYVNSTPAEECQGGYLSTIATGGGPSNCISSDGTDATSCTGGWAKPSWQTGSGVPADGVRDVPDVSFFASNEVYDSAYVVCQTSQYGVSACGFAPSDPDFIGVGGTSVSAPVMAGVMAIVNQKYGRQGNANPTLYRLAASADAAAIFHDITTDGNRVACTFESPDCIVPSGGTTGYTKGYDSTVGYDTVTGLGSIDIANLVNDWTAISFTPTTTTLGLNGSTGAVTAVHGSPIQALVSVNASLGTPGGEVSLTDSATNGNLLIGSLSSGTVSDAVSALPGGNYEVTAHYAGDAQFASSNSSPVTVNISPEPSTSKVSLLLFNPATGAFAPAPSSIVYGNLVMLRIDVSGKSGQGIATGSVTLSDSGTSLGQFALNSQATAEDLPNTLLTGGTHLVTATYGGDASFDPNTGSGSIVITQAQSACTLQTNTNMVHPGWNVVLTPAAYYYNPAGQYILGTMAPPSGTITVYSGSAVIAGPTAVAGYGGGVISVATYQTPYATIGPLTIPVSQLPSPTAPLTFVYSGDANYSGCTSAPVQLAYETGPVASLVGFTLSAYQNILIGTPVTMNANVIVANQPPLGEPMFPAPTGTVQLEIDGAAAGSPVALTSGLSNGTVPDGLATLAIPTSGLAAGMHAASLSYSGDANYLSSTSAQISFWVGTDDFSISANDSQVYVVSGTTAGPVGIIVSNSGGAFSGTVSFSCSGLPTGTACTFNPTTVTNIGSTILTITTTQAQDLPAGEAARLPDRHSGWMVKGGSVSFALVVVLLVPRRRRKGLLLFVILIGLSGVFVSSCGGGSGSTSPPPTIYATTTNLTATTASPAKGASDTFTATVSSVNSSTIPAGSVQFSTDGTASGSAVSLSNGTAQFATSFSAAGTHSVTAAYSGDSTHQSSTSSPYSISVPYTSGTIPGTYSFTVTGTSGTLSHSTSLDLIVQQP